LLYKWSGGNVLSKNKEIAEQIPLDISPNPTTGIVNIDWKNTNNDTPQYLRVTDALGKVVFEKKAIIYHKVLIYNILRMVCICSKCGLRRAILSKK
jgi:hypothetical protein